MFMADSSTLKSESEAQMSAAPPTIPSVVACCRIASTACTMLATELFGNARFSSWTRKLASSGRPESPSNDTIRNRRGTNESSAKYAIIAAR